MSQSDREKFDSDWFRLYEDPDSHFEEGEPDWEFFLPDEAPDPDPSDFWIEDDYGEAA